MKPVIGIAVLVILAYVAVVLGGMAFHNFPAGASQDTVVPAVAGRSGGPVLATQLPESPGTVPVFIMTGKSVYSFTSPNLSAIRTSVPTESEAPALARNALEPYGGLPGDAVIRSVERITLKKYNTSTGSVEAEYPQYTEVTYSRELAGYPFLGPGNILRVGLGENGALLMLDKSWQSLNYSGDMSVISAEEAFEKLKNRELVEIPQCCIDDLAVSEIRLGYYINGRDSSRNYALPVWIFFGRVRPEIDPMIHPFIVDARKEK